MGVTANRKRRFATEVLGGLQAKIGFVDVGSGGDLKAPWRHLPPVYMETFCFEPTDESSQEIVCVSDRCGAAKFHVAHNERASSFHEPVAEFVERFAQSGLLTKKTLDVRCTTLDEHFTGRYQAVDALDVNTEGHDLHVLKGGAKLLEEGMPKLLKVEFELAAAWHDQGWFSDIESYLRARGYDLVDMEVEYARPASVGHFYNKGEPVWGKALFVPGAKRWQQCLVELNHKQTEIEINKSLALLVAAGLPGRAFDLLDAAAAVGLETDLEATKKRIAWVFGWARLEYGLTMLSQLGGGLGRLLGWGVDE